MIDAALPRSGFYVHPESQVPFSTSQSRLNRKSKDDPRPGLQACHPWL